MPARTTASCSPPTAARPGFCIDPIEKKPLNHFLPGTPVLSFGTAGCNLACNFCQNHDISKSRDMDRVQAEAQPEAIARAAERLGCRSVAFTYNDPVIFHEYAADIAQACRARGVKTVAVTAGYVTDRARADFFRGIDAANVDLKAFTQRFYRTVTKGDLQPVLDTLLYLRHETDIWFEITTLVIPGENDSEREIDAMCAWGGGEPGRRRAHALQRLPPRLPGCSTSRAPPSRRSRWRGAWRCGTACATPIAATSTTSAGSRPIAMSAAPAPSAATGTRSPTGGWTKRARVPSAAPGPPASSPARRGRWGRKRVPVALD